DEWNRTYYPKEANHLNVEKQWYIVDAADKRLSRLASSIANHIRGKDQPTYTPSIDMGTYVIVVSVWERRLCRVLGALPSHFTPTLSLSSPLPRQVNVEKVAVTGKKRAQKIYRQHSGRPGGMTEETFDQVRARIPERIVEHAVRGMLPKGRVSRGEQGLGAGQGVWGGLGGGGEAGWWCIKGTDMQPGNQCGARRAGHAAQGPGNLGIELGMWATLGLAVWLSDIFALVQDALTPFLSPLLLSRSSPLLRFRSSVLSSSSPSSVAARQAAPNSTAGVGNAPCPALEAVAVAHKAGSGNGGDGGEARDRDDGVGGGKRGEEEQQNEAPGDVQTPAQLSRYTEAMEARRRRNRSDVTVTRVLEAEARQWRQRTYQQRGFLYEFSAYRISPSRFVVLGISSLNFLWVTEGEGCRWVGRDGSRLNGSVWYRDFMRPKTKTDSLAAFCQLWGNTSRAGGYLVMTMDGVEAAVFNEQPGQPLEPPPDASLPVHLTWCSQPLYGTLDAGMVWTWAEYHRVHANVSRFLFYDMAAWSPALSALFAPYFAAGIAAVTDMSGGQRFGFHAGEGALSFITKHQVGGRRETVLRTCREVGALSRNTRSVGDSFELVFKHKISIVYAYIHFLIPHTPLLPSHTLSHHQTLAGNDCIFRSLLTSRWVTLHDTDEFLSPVPPHSLHSLLATHAHAPWLSHGALVVEPSMCQEEREGALAPAGAAAVAPADAAAVAAGGGTREAGAAVNASNSHEETAPGTAGNGMQGGEAQWDEAAVAEAKRRAVEVLSRLVFRRPEVWCVRDRAEGQQIDSNLCDDWQGHRKLILNPRKTEVMSIHKAREPEKGGVVLNAGTELRHFHLPGVVNPVNVHCQTLVPPGEDHVWFVRDTTIADQLRLLANASALQPLP
ncbi:unnamed protein product, partial [Closterium sp. NIES-54]